MSSTPSAVARDDVSVEADEELEEAFFLLKNTRRRFIVDVVNWWPERSFETNELANLITKFEEGGGPVTGKKRKSRYVSLIQEHLPKLVEADVLVREETHTYRQGPAARRYAAILGYSRSVIGEGSE